MSNFDVADPKSGAADRYNIEFDLLRSELRSKPGIFAVAATMAGVLALPFGILAVWIPREIDGLRDRADQAITAASDAKTSSEASSLASQRVEGKIDGLIYTIARMDAKTPRSLEEKINFFKDYLPNALLSSFMDSKKLAFIHYSKLDVDSVWVFIPRQFYGEFSQPERDALTQSFSHFDVNFRVDQNW